MPHAYMVRITHSYQDASGVVALWAARAEKMVVYEHVGTKTEKVHIHMVILGSDTHKKQLRNIGMATGLELKGNKYCSFKEWDGSDRPCVYMTKGEYNPSFVKGYSSVECDKWKSMWIEQLEVGADARMYNEFAGSGQAHEAILIDLNKYEHEHSEECLKDLHWKFEFIRKRARNFAFQRAQYIWNLRAINMYKMLVYTYCYRENVPIPDKHQVFKGF